MSCPDERWESLEAARRALLDRRIKASLSGSPPTSPWRPYRCTACGGAHITKDRRAQRRSA